MSEEWKSFERRFKKSDRKMSENLLCLTWVDDYFSFVRCFSTLTKLAVVARCVLLCIEEKRKMSACECVCVGTCAQQRFHMRLCWHHRKPLPLPQGEQSHISSLFR